MRKLLVPGIVAAVFCGSPAIAADMPAKAPVYKAGLPYDTWTGCYLGGNIGYGWSDKHYTGVLGAAAGLSEGSQTADGLVGGGQLGCDYQFSGNWVIGVQGMWDWADVRGSNASTVFPANAFQTDDRSFATVTGRLGYAIDPGFLVYGKAGIGWVQDHNTVTDTGVLSNVVNVTRSGADLGGGLEYKFASNWSAFAEYDHIALGTKTPIFAGVGAAPLGTFPEIIHQSFDTVLVGINYRFGGPASAGH
jgi:outer membrane immunogenic protein